MAFVLAAAFMGCTTVTGGPEPPQYPESRPAAVVEFLHGTEIPDPYRWLEDIDCEETRRWIAAQNRVTSSYLESVPERTALLQRLSELRSYRRCGVPVRCGSRYFYLGSNGSDLPEMLLVADGLNAQPRVILAPEILSRHGGKDVSAWRVSPDGKWLAYAIGEPRRAPCLWKIRNVKSGEDLDDVIRCAAGSTVSWASDSSGIYYVRPRGSRSGQAICYHRTPLSKGLDELIWEPCRDQDWSLAADVTEDGRYLIISAASGDSSRLLCKDLTAREQEPVVLAEEHPASFTLITNDGPRIFLLTNLAAPRGRVVAIDLRQPHSNAWEEVIAEGAGKLVAVVAAADTLVASFETTHAVIRLYGMDGAPRGEVDLPTIGTVGQIRSHRSNSEVLFELEGFATPWTTYRLDADTAATSVLRKPETAFDPDDFTTEQVLYRSSDGTEVPMFLCFRRGLRWDGSTPALLYGYGGFNLSLTPWFDAGNILWMEMGGILAVANIRGGGELGDEWHSGGMGRSKQYSFDDFIAAGEWLIANHYTSREKLAIWGGSNGGLLVGAVLNQRPGLFGAAVAEAGVLDMLRFHRFTVGRAWVPEYGSPDDPEMFAYLHGYSPLHNIRPGTEYPAVLVMTAADDRRVVPGHSFKYIAALQAAQSGPAPVLIRIETQDDSTATGLVSGPVAAAADRLAFLARELGMKVRTPVGSGQVAGED